MIKTKNLCFKDLIFYDDIHVMKNKINFITGESGCGKSTLLKLINHTENSSRGEILYKDKSMKEWDSISLRKEVKLISQTSFLFPGTIKENFSLFYDFCDYEDKGEEHMLRFLGIAEADFLLDTICDHLSGGERQRVYIAICLSMEAETIMLDEPTSALDAALAVKVLGNIVAYVKETMKTLIVISHDQKLTERFAEHLIPLNGGKKEENDE